MRLGNLRDGLGFGARVYRVDFRLGVLNVVWVVGLPMLSRIAFHVRVGPAKHLACATLTLNLEVSDN